MPGSLADEVQERQANGSLQEKNRLPSRGNILNPRADMTCEPFFCSRFLNSTPQSSRSAPIFNQFNHHQTIFNPETNLQNMVVPFLFSPLPVPLPVPFLSPS